MTRLPGTRLLLVAVLLALTSAGCAAHWAYRQGKQASEREDWDLAVARFTRALEKDPKNIGYKIALENARLQASRYHYDEAMKHLAANDLLRAKDELEIATKYDPANRSAADDLALLEAKIRKQAEDQRERAEFEQVKARAHAAARLPVPVLSPRSPVPITMRFEDGSLQKIFESLGRIAGVNVLFDEGFRDKKTSVNLTGVTFQEALDRLTFVNRYFYKVVDQNTVIIVPESRQKRVAYEELVLRTFYVQNAEINDTVNLVKTLAKITTVAGNPALNAITVLGTLDQVAIAERIIDANDKARGEVVVEVQILEVNRTATKRWGLDLSNYSAGLTLSPTGTENELSSSGLLNIRAHLLSSLNQADWVVSIPSSLFARFLQNDSNVKILAAPRLRAAEGKKAELRIGTEVPIPVTSYTVGLSGGGVGQGYLPATSFQYRNVGVNLTLTPRVAASGDITLEMAAEFSLLGEDRNVGSEGNPINVPTFLTRNVSGVLRLRDGETGLIGGLLQGTEASSFSGALGVGNIPLIGTLFGNRQKRVEDWEVVISITPRIVRGPKVTEEDLQLLSVGTQEVPRVEGARPPLFGPASEESVPEPGTDTRGGATPPPAPLSGTQPTPPPAASPEAPPAAPAPAAAAEARPTTALFSPPELALPVGESGGLALVVVGARDVQSVDLVLAWDPTLAEITDVAPGSLLTLDGSPVSAERALESGRARVRFSRAGGASGSGALATITARGLRSGSGSIVVESLVLGRAEIADETAPPAPARLVVTP